MAFYVLELCLHLAIYEDAILQEEAHISYELYSKMWNCVAATRWVYALHETTEHQFTTVYSYNARVGAYAKQITHEKYLRHGLMLLLITRKGRPGMF